jgi:rRNA maturation endonuclease Nob1
MESTNNPTPVEWLYRWINDNWEATTEEALEAFLQAKELEKIHNEAIQHQILSQASNWEEKLLGKNIHSVYTWCKDCHAEGCNIPFNDECGNCGSQNTVRYYDKETIDLLFQTSNK